MTNLEYAGYNIFEGQVVRYPAGYTLAALLASRMVVVQVGCMVVAQSETLKPLGALHNPSVL